MSDTTDWRAVAEEDLKHLRERDRPDEGAVVLPPPGKRHNASAIPVSDLALAVLLGDARVGEVLAGCRIEDCEECNLHNLVWWDCCNALDKSTRIALQSWLNSKGYGLPEAPWEDVDFHGNPTPPPGDGPRA